MDKVYRLSHDYNHSGDPERDAFHVPFEGDNNISAYMIDTEMYGSGLLPDRIYFQANFLLIPKYDYPLTDLNIPVMHHRMLDVFLALDEIKYEGIPVIMIDDTYLGERFDGSGNLNPTVPKNEDYLAIRLTDGLHNFLDLDRSDYRPSRVNPNIPSRIRKTVLKKPDQGFPPLFRVKFTPSALFISQAAKEALEANNIKGCVFEEVEVS